MSKPENHSLNERCSVCGMPLRMMRGGSMTQWISTCACAGIRLQKDNLSKSLNCSTCKKRIRLGKHGSITNWVFQDDVCSCVTSKPILPVMAADRDETAKEEDRQSTEFNITDTTFPLDRYEPRAILGIGSAGIVYLAKDLKSNKDVAVKLLHLPEEEELLRFQKEARSTSKLNHPKIVKVLDFGVTGNVPYLVLEYIEGVTLFKLIDSAGALSLDTALEIALQICQGVEHAHNKGILHGDLNPENILVVTQFLDDPEIRIIDFGIARLAAEFVSDMENQAIGSNVLYMAPDTVLGYKTSERSDIYSIGCILFEMITGNPPFTGSSKLDVREKHSRQAAPTLANLSPDQDIDWPEPLEALIAKALAKDPGERFGTAKEMSDSIAKLIREVESLYSETEGSYGDHLHPQEIQANAAITEKNRKTLFLIAFSGIALTLVATAIMYQNLTRDPINSAFKQYDEISKHTDEADDRNSPKPVAGTNDFNWQRGRLLGSAKLVSWATAVRTVKDADLRQLESQTDLKHLDLSNSAIDGSGFSNIAHLPLLAVNASSTKLNNNGLEQLCSIPSVSRLELNNLKNVDGDGICKLVNLPKLSYLSLHECKLVDQDISALAKLNNLHSLNLGDNKGITNLALQRIIEVNPKLTGLYIGGTGASIEILSSLDKDKIRALGIHDLPITSEQLADLPFKKLFIIAVGGKNFSDTHLLALSNFKHMKILIIIDAPSITEEGLIALQKKLPACRVSRI